MLGLILLPPSTILLYTSSKEGGSRYAPDSIAAGNYAWAGNNAGSLAGRRKEIGRLCSPSHDLRRPNTVSKLLANSPG